MMTGEFNVDKTMETEKTYERAAVVIGRLGDFELGNHEDGIPSRYADKTPDELKDIAEDFADKLKKPTDLHACSCIDGRHVLCNADGSDAEVRLRRVGGSASNTGVAFNADAPVIATLNPDASLKDQVKAVDAFVAKKTGFERSAHLGGCGGANGEPADHEAINTNPNILGAVKAFMEIPLVRDYFGVGYSDTLGERVRENAGKTAQMLRAADWNGQAYVDGVKDKNPRGVEELEVDHDDEKFHGHKENSLVVIIGDKTLDVDDEFVWNLRASKEVAKALGGDRDEEGYQQALIAEIAKHFAVANRLPGPDTPVLLVQG